MKGEFKSYVSVLYTLQGVTIPSQQRYVRYVERVLMSPDITFSSRSMRLLSKVVMHTVPNFDTAGGCSEFELLYKQAERGLMMHASLYTMEY